MGGVTVAPNESVEVDFIAREITHYWANDAGAATGDVAMRTVIVVPSGWTVSTSGLGTVQLPVVTGWDDLWNGFTWAAMGTAWTDFGTTSLDATVAYYTDFSTTDFTDGNLGALDDGSANTPGDKDGTADEMGVDALINVPVGTTPGIYEIVIIGVGHAGIADNKGNEATGNKAQASVLGTFSIEVATVATPGITVTPTTGLTTTEAGGTATFDVVLDTQPTADVTIGLSSSDTGEGAVSPASVTFTSAN
jgi:hypothetical protein